MSEQNIKFSKKDERVLDKVWERIAIRQGKGYLWEEYRKKKKG